MKDSAWVKECAESAVQFALQDLKAEISRAEINKAQVIDLDTATQRYPNTKNLSIGTFTVHPYDRHALTRLESFHASLAMEKDDELVILLGRMGAQTVKITDNSIGSKSLNATGDASKLNVGVEASAALTKVNTADNELTVKFEGGAVEIDRNMLRHSRWFSGDSRLSAILESRSFSSNRMAQYTIRNTYQETFDFDFDVAMKYLVVKVDIKGQYTALSRKERTFHVEFGPV